MSRNLTNLYVSESFQYLVQISGSGFETGLGSSIPSINITASNAVSASFAVSSSNSATSISSSYSSVALSSSFATSAQTATSSSFATNATSASFAVTASYALNAGVTVNTASLLTTASAVNNVITFTKGDSSQFTVTVATGSAVTVNTGSLMTTGSVNANILTFTKGDGSTFDLIVATGSAISASFASTASLALSVSTSISTQNLQHNVLFVDTSGPGIIQVDAGLRYNPNTDLLTTTSSFALNATSASLALNNVLTASVSSNTITFTKGDGTTFPITVDTGSAVTVDTGSLLVTASISNATTTFTKGDGSQFSITANNVVNATSASVAVSASVALSSSFAVSSSVANLAMTGGGLINGTLSGATTSMRSAPYLTATPATASGGNSIALGSGAYTLGAGSVAIGTATQVQGIRGVAIGNTVFANGLNAVAIGYNITSSVSNGVNINGAFIYDGLIKLAYSTIVTGSVTANSFTGSLLGTASFATNATSADTASFLPSTTNLNITSISASTAVFQSASIGYLQTITGSVVNIGDSFIILNTSDATRYAGIKVEDSGSGTPQNYTASFQFDSQTNDWFYEYSGSDPTNFGVAMFGPEYNTIGSPVYLTNNRLSKGDGGHHLNDSTITDDGTNVTFTTPIAGTAISASTGFNGNLTGTASFATTASFALNVTPIDTGSFVTTASIANATTTFTKGDGSTFNTTVNNVVNADSASVAVSASYALFAAGAGAANSATSASQAISASFAQTALTALTASFFGGTVSSASFAATGGGLVGGTGGGAGTAMRSAPYLTATPATASGANSIALGSGAYTIGGGTVAIGTATQAQATRGVAIGNTSMASGMNSVAIGYNVTASGTNGININGIFNFDGTNIRLSNSTLITGSLTTTTGAIISGSLNVTGSVLGNVLGNNTDTYTGSAAIQQVVTLTQTEYNAISGSANANTFYVISDSIAVNPATFATTGSNTFNGNQIISGSLSVTNGITGSMLGTASFAVFAIGAGGANSATSASYALSASFATSALSASFATSAATATSASFATSAATATSSSFATNANTATSASFATTASFYSLASVTQNAVFSGSVRGEVRALSISSNTASLDCSTDNFYTLTLVSGSNTFINPSNIAAGQTINLRVTQANPGNGTVSFPTSVKQVSGSSYVPSVGAGPVDIVTFISFDASSLYLSNVKNLV